MSKLLLGASLGVLFSSQVLAKNPVDLPVTEAVSGSISWEVGDASASLWSTCRIDDKGVMHKVLGCTSTLAMHYTGEPAEGVRRGLIQNSASLYFGDYSVSSNSETYPYEMRKIVASMAASGAHAPVKITTSHIKGIDVPTDFKSHDVRLLDFNKSLKLSEKLAREASQSKVNQYNMMIGTFTILAVFAFFLSIWFVKNRAAPEAARVISDQKQAIKEKSEERLVAKIAKEESIRQTVRESVSEANEEQVAVLKKQIKEALDKDDTKTATVLMGLLEQAKGTKNEK
ncbi:hypothetical protein [Vibrio sp. 10N.261.46.A3]|uniref:hypothetical protein n=1 Tax=Vibrio sp. 10N.261.46.A3 TaxID=3229658 RepID=UPI00354B6BF9